ncbi:MFS transporter [Tahibacter soli]|uniref:MFS transporter n=1 Tax=Tahibacter soli TaxID=2983605 RepID=A0A9X3YJJ6_9GAMM|nr:MFS transporter [Tahibacter soli]MDC8013554.1 MFS transporter [Tahibacter soli]
MTTPAPAAGAFAPLRQTTFAVLWVATVLGNTGTFMRDVASAWLMTGLSPSPTAVALVQTAAALPVFLLAIPAGVLADILDRRRFLIFSQLWLAAVSATLFALAASGRLTVEALIALTFAGGIGAALSAPSWQAIVPELVPRPELKSAVALNSLGVNIARAIGPAAGGLALAHFGAGVVYGADVASYVVVIAALVWWRRPRRGADDLSERFVGAFRAGLRYARNSRELHVVLLRAAMFFAFASSAWALLPLVARQMLGGGAGFYGVLLGAVGIGAIAGAIGLPRLRAKLDADGLMLAASLVAAGVLGALASSPPQWLAIALLFALGVAWIVALTTLAGVTQSVLPNWVRGRGLAIYLMVFNGAMAAGSLVWGLVAQRCGLAATLLIGGAGLALAALALHRVALPAGEADLEPAHHLPDPLVAVPVEHDRGPVMVTIEYRVAHADQPAFLSLLRRLAQGRRRDGAYQWGVAEDAADPERIVEWFLVESWAEHLRQHERASAADADLAAEARRFHIGAEPPLVRHLLAPHG